ncbi:hypothetical protein SAMN06265222_102396 [Neorhodopirellula lusitana]|uniref:histidine kinase n=1 Tax=Neorhodopirellula lusitana TaxID=445327 RepID=A0ABY1PYP8_9BACT|nr:HAMP domain-containing sensor histidine kinase [Neorhodopirellula lusitana]SMP48226.1 hypothetical protein SAMN06265222_102396 [Neorhodopirellula lusitana]
MPPKSPTSSRQTEYSSVRPHRVGAHASTGQRSKTLAMTPSNSVAQRVDQLDQPRQAAPMAHASQASLSKASRTHATTSKPDGTSTSHAAQSESDTAIRLISETAHDLRSPLASVAATLEIVSDGELGPISGIQSECLKAALRQCEYLNTLVGEMLHADGLLNGMTRLRRRAVDCESVQQMVTEATAAVLVGKRIDLLFDTSALHNATLYVDPSLLCRLLVNLVINASRASSEGSHILVRIWDDADAGVANWSVSDCGAGMSAKQMNALGNLGQQRACDGATGTGLGLMICRQLATLQFSSLNIQSRQGSGTDIKFETPLAQPTAIATAYAHFRSSIAKPSQSTADATLDEPTRNSGNDHSDSAAWNFAALGYAGTGPARLTQVAIGTLQIGDDLSAEQSDAIDAVIQSRLGRFEISYRSTRCGWTWVFDADREGIENRIAQLDNIIRNQFGPLDVRWGETSIVPVNFRTLQRTLVDRITKQSLSAASASAGAGVDHDEVRLGTQPLSNSPVASMRLDQQLRTLTARFKKQSNQLQESVHSLRPPTTIPDPHIASRTE